MWYLSVFGYDIDMVFYDICVTGCFLNLPDIGSG
jgi:hypothetical protein